MSHSKPPISLPPFFLNCCDRNGAQDPKVIVYVPNQDDTFDRFARSVIDVLKDHCEHPRDCNIEFFIRRTLGDMEIDASIEDTMLHAAVVSASTAPTADAVQQLFPGGELK
jgi:hypothetical protein